MSSRGLRLSLRQRLLYQLAALLAQEWQAALGLALHLYAWATRTTHRGLYDILEYDSTLELHDPQGQRATFHKRQRVRFRQDHILAFQDYAWGDGDIFAEYRCSPGVAVDRYQEGDRWNILISLRETKRKGDITEFLIERTVQDGFTQAEEWQQAEIRHPTRHLRLAVVFPLERPCRRATLQARSRHHTQVLGAEHFQTLPDGRQQVVWETRHARDLEIYTLRWRW